MPSEVGFCHRLRQFLIRRIRKVKRPHSPQVEGGQAGHGGEFPPKVDRQHLDHTPAVSLVLLGFNYRVPNVPVQQDQLTVRRKRSFDLRSSDALFHPCQQSWVSSRHQGFTGHIPSSLNWRESPSLSPLFRHRVPSFARMAPRHLRAMWS